MLVGPFHGGCDGFAVGDLGAADLAADIEFPAQAVYDDLQMQFAHARDDGFAGLLVIGDKKGWILCRQRMQRGAEFLVVIAARRPDGDRNDRGGKLDRFQHNGVFGIAERVAGAGLGQADHGHNVSRVRHFDRLLAAGMHAEQAANAGLGVKGCVADGGADLERARIDAHEGDLAHVLVG